MADDINQQLTDIKARKVDSALVTKAGLAMVMAGHDWQEQKDVISKLPADEQLKTIEALAHQSLRETPLSKKDEASYDPNNPTILDAQTNSYIQRSYAEDATEGKAKGTNLKAYLDEVNAKTKEAGFTDDDFKRLKTIDFDNPGIADKMWLASKKSAVEKLQGDINGAAAKYIDPKLKGVSFQQDLINTVQADDQKPDNEKLFSHAKPEETRQMSGGIMELILMFIGALLGIDIGGLMSMFGGGKAAETQNSIQREAQKKGISFKEFEKQVGVIKEKAAELSNDKDPDGKHPHKLLTDDQRDKNVSAIEQFAGIKDVHPLTREQANELGDMVAKDIDKMHHGKIAVGDLGKDIRTTVEKDNAANAHAAGVSTELTVTSAALGPVGGALATGALEGAKGWVEKPINEIMAFVSKMPKAVATGPDHGNAPGGTGVQIKGGAPQVAQAPEQDAGTGRH